MCESCSKEYKTSDDIRFHSQTNSCPNCGITLKLTNNSGEILSESNTEIFKIIGEKLALGKIIALKNTAGYLLICDATNEEAVKELRVRGFEKEDLQNHWLSYSRTLIKLATI